MGCTVMAKLYYIDLNNPEKSKKKYLPTTIKYKWAMRVSLLVNALAIGVLLWLM